MVCGGFIPHAPFRFACANEWHRCAEIRVSPGGREGNISSPDSLRFCSQSPGPPRPRPESLFARAKSNQKHAQGRDPFDGVPPLCTPPPRRHKGGRLPSFGFPRRSCTRPGQRGKLPGVLDEHYWFSGVSPSFKYASSASWRAWISHDRTCFKTCSGGSPIMSTASTISDIFPNRRK